MVRALLGQKAENKYVGVNSGIMDQFASACGVKDNLLLLDCRSLEWKPIPLPEDVSIVIADTKVRRKLTSGEYNKRRSACEEAVRLLKGDLPNIKSLRDVKPDDFNRLAGKLPEEVEKRARHVVEEIQRSDQSQALLEAGDIQEGLNAASAIGDDRLQRQASGSVSPESFTHGSSEQRVRWFKRGYESGSPDACDTFAARSL